ncbi:MAG: hypothetical protein OXE17_01070 [Chloroflexi bacterium]|nr:hypothetical protein [Chloroflexota bacterium]
MRDKTRTNGKPGPSGSNRTSGTDGRKTPRETAPQRTDAERETTQTGLRILARMIARAHLRRDMDQAAQKRPPEPGTGA